MARLKCDGVVRLHGDKHFPQPQDGMLVFDMANPVARALWASECVNMTRTGYVDGCFSDRSTQTPPGASAAYTAGHLKVHQALQQQLGGVGGGPLVANNDGALMPGVNALMLESFDASEASIKRLRAVDAEYRERRRALDSELARQCAAAAAAAAPQPPTPRLRRGGGALHRSKIIRAKPV